MSSAKQKSDLNHCENVFKNVIDEIKELRNKDQQQKLEIHQLHKDKDKLKKEKEELSEYFDISHQNNNKLNKENQNLYNENQQLLKQEQSNQNQIQRLVKKLKSSQEETQGLKEDAQKLRNTNKNVWSSYHKTKKQLKEVQRNNDDKKGFIFKLVKELNAKKTMVQKQNHRLQSMQNQIRRLQNGTPSISSQNAPDVAAYNNLYQHFQLVRTNNDELRKGHNNLREKLKASNQQNMKLKKKIQTINVQRLNDLERDGPILDNKTRSRTEWISMDRYLNVEKEKQAILERMDTKQDEYKEEVKKFRKQKQQWMEEKEQWKKREQNLLKRLHQFQNKNNKRESGKKRIGKEQIFDDKGYEQQPKKFKR